jgi:hypothetical protein
VNKEQGGPNLPLVHPIFRFCFGQLKTKHHLEVNVTVPAIGKKARERIGLAE